MDAGHGPVRALPDPVREPPRGLTGSEAHRSTRTFGGLPPGVGDATIPCVNSDQTIAETLPRLYRDVLDALARLEQLGAMDDAARLRSEAIAAYSRAWDAKCSARLAALLGRIDLAARTLERSRRPRLA